MGDDTDAEVLSRLVLDKLSSAGPAFLLPQLPDQTLSLGPDEGQAPPGSPAAAPILGPPVSLSPALIINRPLKTKKTKQPRLPQTAGQ